MSSLEHISLLPSLTDLDISGNAMVTLPPHVQCLTMLHSLRIRSMGLYVLTSPSVFFSTPNLCSHAAGFRYELPSALSLFTSLTHLDFGDNRLEIAAPEFV